MIPKNPYWFTNNLILQFESFRNLKSNELIFGYIWVFNILKPIFVQAAHFESAGLIFCLGAKLPKSRCSPKTRRSPLTSFVTTALCDSARWVFRGSWSNEGCSFDQWLQAGSKGRNGWDFTGYTKQDLKNGGFLSGFQGRNMMPIEPENSWKFLAAWYSVIMYLYCT